jgi:hypothetical protein
MRFGGRTTIALLAFSLVPMALRAQGGPPLLTDDPGTPGNRHWEINVGFTVERSSAATLLETPRIDLNYGLGERIQLKYELPWRVLEPSSMGTRSGLGNSLMGVKWRFLDEERGGISISTYPQLEFNNPTSSADRDLAEKGLQFLLPVETSKRIGPLQVNLEFGYHFKEFRPDEWLYGLAVAYRVHPRLELLGELHGTSLRNFAQDELIFDLGGRFRLDRHLVLLFTTGRSVRGVPDEAPFLFGYWGLQFNF